MGKQIKIKRQEVKKGKIEPAFEIVDGEDKKPKKKKKKK